ncbi:MAG: hypothetical protein PVI11_03980 [Candidatus Aminicenantes bacterium]|jgi:hypothetical protein
MKEKIRIKKNRMSRVKSRMKCLRLGLVFTLVFGLFILLSAQAQLSVYIEEVLVIGDLHEDLLYKRPGLTVDNEENIYITDLRNNLIKKFDKNGELIKGTGLKGRRPVGLQGPSLIKYHNKKVYVSEVSSPGILVYSQDLEYEREIPIPFTVTDMHVISEVQMAVTALKREYEEGRAIYCIYIYDIETEETENIIYARGRSLSMMNMVNFVVDRRGEFVVAYNWEDKIEKLDSEGEILWTQSLLDNRRVRMREEKDPRPAFGEYPVEAAYKAIALDNRGYILVLGGHLSENINRDIYVLRENGQYLTTFTLPEPAHAIHMDRNNFLYTRSSKEASFRKYALKYFYE